MKLQHRWPCRSWLISAVENEHFVEKQRLSNADAVILELEAGAYDKDLAREAAVKALHDGDYGTKLRILRVNPLSTEAGPRDFEAAVSAPLDAVMLPKVHNGNCIAEADATLSELEARAGLEVGSIEITAMMETPESILTALEIARSSPRLTALCFGPGDYTAGIRGRFTIGTSYPAAPGAEILMARSTVVAACRAAGISPIDGPPTGSVRDLQQLLLHGWQSRALGFDGMIILSPGQVDGVHEAFTPTGHEIAHARHVLSQFEQATSSQAGVVGTADNEMVSETIVEIYQDTLRRAGVLG